MARGIQGDKPAFAGAGVASLRLTLVSLLPSGLEDISLLLTGASASALGMMAIKAYMLLLGILPVFLFILTVCSTMDL